MRSIAFLAAVAAVVTVPALAFAADLNANPPEPATPLPAYAQYDWTGFYAGAQAGYGWGKSGGTSALASRVPDPKGAFGGLHAGYNYQFPAGLVLGVEGDANLADLKGDSASVNSKMDWNASIRARAGYGFDRVLPYVTGGVAFGGYKIDPIYGLTGVRPFSDTLTGWTIGGGLEYGFTDNITGRLEYRYTDYGKMSAPNGILAPPTVSHTDLKTNDVRLGVSYKF